MIARPAAPMCLACPYHPASAPLGEQIAQAVARRYGVCRCALSGPDRSQHVTEARHVAMHLCRQAGMTCADVGKLFNRDTSTVVVACQSIAGRIVTEAELGELIEKLQPALPGKEDAR